MPGTGEMCQLTPDLKGVVEGSLRHYFQREKEETGLLEGLPNYKLNTLCDHFGIALNHHEALSDARGAAKIMIELSKLSLFHDFFPH